MNITIMRYLTFLIISTISVLCMGQVNYVSQEAYYVKQSAEEFLLNEKNDWIMINPSKRIYRDNPTVYIENDFERTYQPYSNKNRIDSDSFLAEAGGFILLKSTMFIFEKGFESLFQPQPNRNKTAQKRGATHIASKLRAKKGIRN